MSCPERLFRLGMLFTHLSKVAMRIIKTNHTSWSIKHSRAEILQMFQLLFWKIDGSILNLTFRGFLMSYTLKYLINKDTFLTITMLSS